MVSSSRIFGKQYSFPSVSIRETVRGPVPITTAWRNTIGVAGIFSKGPEVVKVSNRQDFVALYGDDDTPGSVFVRQAMMQGATEFVISRVMPVRKPISGVITLSNPANPVTFEPRVAEGANRTVGFTIKFYGIARARLAPAADLGVMKNTRNEYVPISLSSNVGEEPNIAGFRGWGSLYVRPVERINPTELVDFSLPANEVTTDFTLPAIAPSTEKIYIATFSSTDPNAQKLVQTLKPGMLLNGTNAVDQEVVSYVYARDLDTYGVLLKGTPTATGVTSLSVKNPTGLSVYYTFAVQFQERTAGSGLGATIVPSILFENAGLALNILTVTKDDSDFQEIKLLEIDGDYFNEFSTNVKFAFGRNKSITEYEINVNRESIFFIDVFRAEVGIGETDTSATGFPETPNAIPANISGLEILQVIKDAILTDPYISRVINDVTINDALLPYTLVFETDVKPRFSQLKYKVDKVFGGSVDPDDMVYENDGSTLFGEEQDMIGEIEAFSPASTYLYDNTGQPLVYIEAFSPGLQGNNITLSVRPLDEGRFSLDVNYRPRSVYESTIPPESYIVSNYNVDVSTGIYPETANSFLIRAYFIPVLNSGGAPVADSRYRAVPTRKKPPIVALNTSDEVATNEYHPRHSGVTFLSGIRLTGGEEPPDYARNATPEDYVEAVRRLENEDVAILSVAGINVSDIRFAGVANEVVIQVQNATPYNGLRIGVLNAPPGVNASRATIITSTYSNPNIVVVGGYSTLAGTRQLGVNAIPPAGYYCGYVAMLPIQVSPAAMSGGSSILGPQSLDSTKRLDELDRITNAQLEMLVVDPMTKSYKFLNGRSTSFAPEFRWISVQRVAHYIIMNLFNNLGWARSSPNTSELRERIASACDAFMENVARQGLILSYGGSVVDSANNQESDYAAGRVNILLNYVPLFPADYINIEVVRSITSSFTLDLSRV